MSATQIVKELATRWTALPAEQKKSYEQRATEAKTTYITQRDEYLKKKHEELRAKIAARHQQQQQQQQQKRS